MNDKDKHTKLIEKFLKELVIFKSLSDRHIEQLAKDFVVFQVKKGNTIFYQSDSSTDLYIILEGVVRATLLNQNGEELVLASFEQGNFFGEMSLLDGKPRSATIVAAEDSTLGMFKREKFISAIKNDPTIATDLLSALVQRLRTANDMIESLAFLDVSQRLIKFFLQIAKTKSHKDKDGFLKIEKLTQREIASRTGASREAISKVLKVLIFKGILKDDGDCFLISPEAEEEAY